MRCRFGDDSAVLTLPVPGRTEGRVGVLKRTVRAYRSVDRKQCAFARESTHPFPLPPPLTESLDRLPLCHHELRQTPHRGTRPSLRGSGQVQGERCGLSSLPLLPAVVADFFGLKQSPSPHSTTSPSPAVPPSRPLAGSSTARPSASKASWNGPVPLPYSGPSRPRRISPRMSSDSQTSTASCWSTSTARETRRRAT